MPRQYFLISFMLLTNHMKMLLGLFLRVSLVGWDLRPGFRKTLAKSGMDTNFKNVIQRSSFSWRFYKSEHFFVPFAIDLDSRLKERRRRRNTKKSDEWNMFCKKQGFSKHTCFDNMKKHFICWHVFLHKICQHIEKMVDITKIVWIIRLLVWCKWCQKQLCSCEKKLIRFQTSDFDMCCPWCWLQILGKNNNVNVSA